MPPERAGRANAPNGEYGPSLPARVVRGSQKLYITHRPFAPERLFGWRFAVRRRRRQRQQRAVKCAQINRVRGPRARARCPAKYRTILGAGPPSRPVSPTEQASSRAAEQPSTEPIGPTRAMRVSRAGLSISMRPACACPSQRKVLVNSKRWRGECAAKALAVVVYEAHVRCVGCIAANAAQWRVCGYTFQLFDTQKWI